jgi:hypothetical protein
MPKERNVNPVQAQHKADKAKAIKKGTYTHSVSHAQYRSADNHPQERPRSPRAEMRNSQTETPKDCRNKLTS